MSRLEIWIPRILPWSLNMFQELNYRFNQTIVMITHNPEAAAMCRRIVQMRDGHIIEPAVSVQM
jgi:putative ABC transport system ATP-binding protein